MGPLWVQLKTQYAKPNIKAGFFFILGILAALGFQYITTTRYSGQIGKTMSRDFTPENDSHLGPLISPQEEYQGINDRNALDLKKQVATYIYTQKGASHISHASVYFRDLSNGPWFGINETERFLPGSLLKVPLAMSVMKLAEKNPQLLDLKIKYTHTDQNRVGKNTYTEGEMYTMRQLLEHMLMDSDNASTLTISDFMDSGYVFDSYRELGIEIPDTEDYKISVRNYASFFRILYNASYLTRSSSEYLLELLAKSNFDEGITTGIPREITVANKYGIREVGNEQQLHDCGIVYYPNRPYMICIMTQGNDLKNLAESIQKISAIVYKKIESQKD
jgi:beta-lactamase class A